MEQAGKISSVQSRTQESQCWLEKVNYWAPKIKEGIFCM